MARLTPVAFHKSVNPDSKTTWFRLVEGGLSPDGKLGRPGERLGGLFGDHQSLSR